MTTILLHHDDSLDHKPPYGHPERPDRIRAILEALKEPRFAALAPRESRLAEDALLRLAHPQSHIDAIRNAAPESGLAQIDADTHMSPGTLQAALRAAGAAAQAVDLVLDDEATNVFSCHRPPGHHAERETAMGFCFFSNAAIAALHALENHGLERVAIMDFDVHHGNGTQDILERDKRAMYLSTHESPLFPGTGAAHETGVGNVVNVPLYAATESAEFRTVFATGILPPLDRFAPELLIISAGFDAHRRDPLANILLEDADFGWMTEELCEIAQKHCQGRVVSLLEGGYDLQGLAGGAAAHVAALMKYGEQA